MEQITCYRCSDGKFFENPDEKKLNFRNKNNRHLTHDEFVWETKNVLSTR